MAIGQESFPRLFWLHLTFTCVDIGHSKSTKWIDWKLRFKNLRSFYEL